MRTSLLVLTLLFGVSANAATELFCTGEAQENDGNVGEKNYLVLMDDAFTKYQLYEGMQQDPIMVGELSTDRLFYYEFVRGEYQSIFRQFELSRVTLKYHLTYTMRNGTVVSSRGQCEPYHAKL